jgi:hypothetical protein
MPPPLPLLLVALAGSAHAQDTGLYEPLVDDLDDPRLPQVEPVLAVPPQDHFAIVSDPAVHPELAELLQQPGAITAFLPPGFLTSPQPPGDPLLTGLPVLDLVLPELGLFATLGETDETSWYPGSRSWVGRGLTDDHELVLTSYAGQVSGLLTTPHGAFDLTGNASGSVVLTPIQALDDAEDASVDPPAPQPPPNDPFPWAGGNGPYDNLDVIDIAYVYGADALNAAGTATPVLRLEGAIINGVATANQAFLASGVRAALRLVAMEQLDWVHPTDTCDARRELVRADGTIDEVFNLRADLVAAVLDHNRVTSGGAGCAGTEASPEAGVTDDNFGFSVNFDALAWSTRHEVGHLAGLCHGRDEGCSVKTSVHNDAFGHQVPDPLEITDAADVCAGFRTIMSKSGTRTIDGTDFTTARQNRFASPESRLARTCGDGTTRQLPTGTYTRSGAGDWADAADRLRETLPELAAYRQPGNVTLAPAARIHTPTPGMPLAAGDTLSWDAASPLNSYFVEVYEPGTGMHWSNARVTGTTTTVSSVPSGTVGVRLWTELATNIWGWSDHRFGNQGLVVDCSSEDASVPPPSQFARETCNDGAGSPVCTLVAGQVTCDLRRGGGGEGWMAAVSGFHDATAYDHAFYGRASDGSHFCCLVNDVGGDVHSVLLEGTYQDDILTASWEADTLDAVDGHSLAVEIRGYAGDDILLGSTSMDPSYTEQLRGFKGNDRLKGFAGDDELRGGHHDDQLSGGSGDDVLVAGRHGQNKLYGGGGSDTLCSERPGDLLVAAFAPESSVVNFLYLSSIGVGGVNPDTTAGGTPSLCGHPVYGSLWGGCTFHNQTTAPARCADFGVQD